jgi:hypothetical protein
MPILVMSDPIIVPLPVYYGTSDTRNGRPVFPKPAFFYTRAIRSRRLDTAEPGLKGQTVDQGARLIVV